MICPKCGIIIDENAEFCNSCGARVSIKSSKELKAGKNRFLHGFLTGAIALFLVVAVLFGTGIARFGGNKQLGSEGKIECEGFSSPEDAVTEYIEALKSKDLNKMISCFAVESYVANYDFQTAIEKTPAFMPLNSSSQWPEIGDFSKAMNVKKRETSVLDKITKQYIVLATNGLPDTAMFNMKDYSDYYDFMSDFVSSNGESSLSEITIKRFISWEQAVQNDPAKYVEVRLSGSCADDLVPVFAEIEFDGSNYIIAMDVAEYDGLWYIFEPNIAVDSDLNSGIVEK